MKSGCETGRVLGKGGNALTLKLGSSTCLGAGSVPLLFLCLAEPESESESELLLELELVSLLLSLAAAGIWTSSVSSIA